ncbi:MAG: hypothetical protein ABI830_07775 [Pseudolabrys sp.]
MMKRYLPSIAALLLAAECFAVWAYFSLPQFTGRARIREAWDNETYWAVGIPLLLVSLMAAGFLARKVKPWQLAAWTVAGHVVAMAVIAKPGSNLGMLPLTVIFVGLPMFGAFFAAAWLGQWLRRRVSGGK